MSRNEEAAWEAARAFGSELALGLGDAFVAAHVVGSLVHGGFRPGTTPLDLTIVLTGDSPSRENDAEIHRLSQRFTEPSAVRYVILLERDLEPPFVPERGTAPEVLRLDDEGVRVAGMDLRPRIVRPKKQDLAAYVGVYRQLIEETLLRRDEDERPTGLEVYELTAAACRHEVFARENLLIWREGDAMMAFCMGRSDHAAVAFVRELYERGPSLEAAPPHLYKNLATFWRDVHAEIFR